MDEHSSGNARSDRQASFSGEKLSENLKRAKQLNREIIDSSQRTLEELEQLGPRIEISQELINELAEEYGISFPDGGKRHRPELSSDRNQDIDEQRQHDEKSWDLGGL